ncbi:MAG: hypothetical protein AAGE52_28840 [Myxococcota bacterium]
MRRLRLARLPLVLRLLPLLALLATTAEAQEGRQRCIGGTVLGLSAAASAAVIRTADENGEWTPTLRSGLALGSLGVVVGGTTLALSAGALRDDAAQDQDTCRGRTLIGFGVAGLATALTTFIVALRKDGLDTLPWWLLTLAGAVGGTLALLFGIRERADAIEGASSPLTLRF